jgi:co-chaperonin GroES (HSP10)
MKKESNKVSEFYSKKQKREEEIAEKRGLALSENVSGLTPLGFYVLVLPEDIERKTEWGFETVTNEEGTRQQIAQIEGHIIEIGPTAWQAYDDGKPWCDVGQKVIFAKHSGIMLEGRDGLVYRAVVDKDILCGVTDE